MKKIRVICGGCGISYVDKNKVKRHRLKTAEDGVFACDDKQAARLVELGVAEYAEEKKLPKQQINTSDLEDDDQPPRLDVADPE